MFVRRWATSVLLAAMILWPRLAHGQVPEDVENDGGEAAASTADDRFFSTGSDQDKGPEVRGSLAVSTFVYGEAGGALTGGGLSVKESSGASELVRAYGDIRGRIDAQRFAGPGWNAHADFRARATGDTLGLYDEDRRDQREKLAGYEVRTQSGTFGGTELELRELYVAHEGERWTLGLGRQIAPDLAATRFDGAQVVYHPSARWRAIVFGGLYPSRISRSLADDYPLAAPDPTVDTNDILDGIQLGDPGPRIFPITGGVGLGYELDKIYGAVGAVAIAPLADDYQGDAMGGTEAARVFVTANGYYRPNDKLDLFHYVIVDAAGAAGARVSNASLMAAYKPTADWRVTGMVNHVDTVTLNVLAQTQLEEAVPPDGEIDAMGKTLAVIQNNAVVTRIAQDEARLSVSRALAQKRFEISAIGALRRRPEIEVALVNGGTYVFPAAQAADATVRFVDRRSFWSTRLAASATAIFGIGENLNRTTAAIGRVDMLRDFSGGKGELDVNLSYIHSRGGDRGENAGCTLEDLNGCYSSVIAHTGQLGATVFYRIADAWFVLGGASFGIQKITTDYGAGKVTGRSPIFMVTAFSRLAYRF
ncbi:MAG TPA: hypothetical protein VFG83_12385 [Kofleriaceae bacterium]|nr:hypothetical protein [Kofleriaceae bacterium]